MLTTFLALIFMLSANPALLPHGMKPDVIMHRDRSNEAAVPHFWIKGPAEADTVITAPPDSIPSRADSLESGLVDPTTFTPEEFEQQKIRAEYLWHQRREFIKQLNGLTDESWNWT